MIVRRFEGLRLVVPPGVYAPREDTALLIAALPEVAGADVLELCAGTGAVALTAARRGAARVIAVDRCGRAVAAVGVNAQLNRVARVKGRRGDLFDALLPGQRFDLIVANPPYLPAAVDRDPRWDAGTDGRAVLDRIVAGASAHLRPGGRLVVVQSGLAGIEQTAIGLAQAGLEVAAPDEHHGPLGPLAAARRGHLERIGLLAPGVDEERMAILVATAPTAAPDAAVAA